MMNSKEKIKNIKSVINEFYHQEKCEGRLTECANDCWKSYQNDCDEIEQDLARLKRLEKELKQTKLNFRNSQTHSKNCYKKLKKKYIRLERAYKNNEVMTRDLNELINRNLELKHELKRSQETINAWMENHKKLIIANGKMKNAIEILKRLVGVNSIVMFPKERYEDITQEEYELLSEVFENDR